eukprot:6417908-Amphidinium_carterae.1
MTFGRRPPSTQLWFMNRGAAQESSDECCRVPPGREGKEHVRGINYPTGYGVGASKQLGVGN